MLDHKIKVQFLVPTVNTRCFAFLLALRALYWDLQINANVLKTFITLELWVDLYTMMCTTTWPLTMLWHKTFNQLIGQAIESWIKTVGFWKEKHFHLLGYEWGIHGQHPFFHPSSFNGKYRVTKKKTIHSLLQLKSVVWVQFYFSRVVWNQNFEPDPTSHFIYALSESEMAQNAKTSARTQ